MFIWVCFKNGGQSEQWQIKYGPGNQDWRMENVKQGTEIQCFL